MDEQIAYFDNSATTFPKPEEVYTFMDKFYRECGVNVGRGQHRLSSKANFLMEDTRKRLLNLFHSSNKEVIFTPTATEAINLILFGIEIPEKACVYISPFEHNAVTRVLHHIQEHQNFEIKQLDVNKSDLSYNIEKIRIQFETVSPFCVIVSHASNVCGTVAPIQELCSVAKEYGAITIIDMCQTAGLIDTDLSGEIYDYAIFEGHKTLYGPMGIGGIILKSNISLDPLIYGGTGIESANPNMPSEVPVRYEAGSHNIQAIAGLNAALKWIENKGINEIYEIEQSNRQKLISILKEYDFITLIDPINSVGVVSCVFEGYSSDNIGNVLSENNIAVRTGLHCAPIAHKFLGTFPEGTVRFSVGVFNSDEDFESLKNTLDYIEQNL